METNQPSTNQNLSGTEVQPCQASSNNNRLFVAIVISVLLTAMITGLIVYFWQKSANEKAISSLEQKVDSLEEQISTQTSLSPPSLTPTLFPKADEMVDWKTFSYKGELSFKYPQNWYIGIHEGVGGGRLLDNLDEINEGDSISFFLEGTEADYGTPDNLGNELLGFIVYGDENVFNNLMNLVPKPTVTTVAEKPALRSSVSIDILIGSLNKRVLHLTVREGAKPYINQILSTFKFTE